MVQLIVGLKGSGKTKRLVELVKEAVNAAHGDVVCIEKDKDLTYDIPYTARLIQAGEYGIASNQLLKGFISGLHAGNYDITDIFIDDFYKLLDDTSDNAVGDILDWMEAFGKAENINFGICITKDADSLGERLKKYL